MKRIWLALWALLLLLTVSETVLGQLSYTTNDGGVTLTVAGYSGTPSAGPLNIPTNINGLKVTAIGASAFAGTAPEDGSFGLPDQYPTSVTIPSSVTNIGADAFLYCVNLTNVTIADGVTSIGDEAFYACSSLTNVYFAGNAPATDPTAFSNDAKATVYYLPDTTGWAHFATVTGLPTVLWNPTVQIADGKFGVQNGRFGFDITGTMNIPIVVEACTDLANPDWVVQVSVRLADGSFYFSDSQWTNYSARYYRISPP